MFPTSRVRSEFENRSEHPTAKGDESQATDNSAHGDHKPGLKKPVGAWEKEAERTDGGRTGDQPTSASPPPSHCAVNQLTRSAAWKVSRRCSSLARMVLKTAPTALRPALRHRAAPEKRQSTRCCWLRRRGQNERAEQSAVAGKGAKPRCRETCTPRTHHRDRIAPDPDVRRAHIGFSHTDNRNHTFRLVI